MTHDQITLTLSFFKSYIVKINRWEILLLIDLKGLRTNMKSWNKEGYKVTDNHHFFKIGRKNRICMWRQVGSELRGWKQWGLLSTFGQVYHQDFIKGILR